MEFQSYKKELHNIRPSTELGALDMSNVWSEYSAQAFRDGATVFSPSIIKHSWRRDGTETGGKKIL